MEPILRATNTADWISILIFTSLFFMALAKGLFYTRFLNFIVLPFNDKYIFMYNKKEKLMNWFHIFFTIFQTINFSLFIYLAWRVFLPSEEGFDSLMYPIIFAGLLLFLVVKIFLQMGNGFIFGANKVISELIFKKLSYLNHSGIIMFIANVMLAYVLKDSKLVVYTALFLILLVNAIGWANLLRIHQKFIAHNFLYFILYLCALEIAPFIIIGSYLKD